LETSLNLLENFKASAHALSYKTMALLSMTFCGLVSLSGNPTILPVDAVFRTMVAGDFQSSKLWLNILKVAKCGFLCQITSKYT
jgi:hypothetical protein